MDDDAAAPLREMWYFALPGARLKRGGFAAKTLLGEPVLLGRASDGSVFALRDVCPHRGIPLHYGRFDGRELECCYHGWRFDTAGRCTAIPSLAATQVLDVGRVRVKSYPAREIQGNVWVFFGEAPDAAPEPPVVPIAGERGPDLFESVRLPCAIDHAVIGLMDPAHGPFVHRAWWWRAGGSIHAKKNPSPRRRAWFHHGAAQAVAQFQRLSHPGRRANDRDRLPPARRAHRGCAGWASPAGQSHGGDAARPRRERGQSRDLLDPAVASAAEAAVAAVRARAFSAKTATS